MALFCVIRGFIVTVEILCKLICAVSVSGRRVSAAAVRLPSIFVVTLAISVARVYFHLYILGKKHLISV